MSLLSQALEIPLNLLNTTLTQCSSNMLSLTTSVLAALSFTSPTTSSKHHQPSYHQSAGVLRHVNPLIGTSGTTPNGNGGMIPSLSPPFGKTRWTPQTRENFISQCPYNGLDAYIHGFQATHQPAIWMGDSGFVVLNPGVGKVEPVFEDRAHAFAKEDERSEVYVYEVEIGAEGVRAGENATESVFSPVPGGGQDVPEEVREGAGGRVRRDVEPSADIAGEDSRAQEGEADPKCGNAPAWGSGEMIKVAMTASSHVGHLRFDFPRKKFTYDTKEDDLRDPYVFIQATRTNWTGHISIDPENSEISGSNPQRQDYALGPFRAPTFSGYFVSRFSKPFTSYGITLGGDLRPNTTQGNGTHLGAWVTFAPSIERVEVRTGVSFVSLSQARHNLDIEAPASVSFDDAVETLKHDWLEKLGRVTIEGINETDAEHDQRSIWYTGLFHALQYPADFSEPLESVEGGRRTWYEGYTDSVQEGEDSYYQSWSIWDTFRAEHSLLTLFAPERINSMLRSLLRIHSYAGRLPMWANVVETNIMIATHVDAVLANALSRGFHGFNISHAWEAVYQNAFVPPENDTDLLFYDRERYTPQEVRAGLTAYIEKGYVPNDGWAEAGSRTLDYAFDDYAASIVAAHANDTPASSRLLARSENYRNIFNSATQSMNSRNVNGTWARVEQGWTEGDASIYTFAVPHSPPGLAELFGSRAVLKSKLDAYFQSGHNDHTNEPSHHIPYLYTPLGYPSSTQPLVRKIAYENYNATSAGLSGNEDLGQMSAWYLFSSLGIYPVNPAGDEYVVGSPFFERVMIRWPKGVNCGGMGAGERTVVLLAPGAPTRPFVESLKVDGVEITKPVLKHGDIVNAEIIEFGMSDGPTAWGGGDD